MVLSGLPVGDSHVGGHRSCAPIRSGRPPCGDINAAERGKIVNDITVVIVRLPAFRGKALLVNWRTFCLRCDTVRCSRRKSLRTRVNRRKGAYRTLNVHFEKHVEDIIATSKAARAFCKRRSLCARWPITKLGTHTLNLRRAWHAVAGTRG